ncbi:MAG: hypothetical protein KKC20_24940 [Proteobacteria bacterium]|nr:hypothetical protein [Pseudomonadota bacterium]
MPPKNPTKTDLSKINLPTLTDTQRAERTMGGMVSTSALEPAKREKEKTEAQKEQDKKKAERHKNLMGVHMPLGIKPATEALKTELGFPCGEIVCVLIIDLLKKLKTDDEFQKKLEYYKLNAHSPNYEWKIDLEKYIIDTLGSPLE